MLQFYLALIDSPEEKSKFEQLYMEYRELLLRVARSILPNEADAEDVLHQAFLRIANNMSKIGEVSSHQTRNFLVIIVRGLALNLYNEQRRVIDLPFEDLDEMKDPLVLEDQIAKQFGYEALRHALERLPLIHRDVLYLMYFEELSVKEIARFLFLPENTVKKRLERARQALKKTLLEEGITADENRLPVGKSSI